MTPPRRWPENAEEVRTQSLSKIRHMRDVIRCAMKLSREADVIKQLTEALEETYVLECDLKSVGPKAEKEQRAVIL